MKDLEIEYWIFSHNYMSDKCFDNEAEADKEFDKLVAEGCKSEVILEKRTREILRKA